MALLEDRQKTTFSKGECADISAALASESEQQYRTLKRVLTQCFWAAVRNKKSQFYGLFQRWRVGLEARKAIIAVAHRMLIVIWKLLHEGETYTDAGCQLTPRDRYAAAC